MGDDDRSNSGEMGGGGEEAAVGGEMADRLAAALQELFDNVGAFVQGELNLAASEYRLLESLNLRVAAEYDHHADFAAGLRVFVGQVREKHQRFRAQLEQIDEIERQVTALEALVSTLDTYTNSLYSSLMAAYNKPL